MLIFQSYHWHQEAAGNGNIESQGIVAVGFMQKIKFGEVMVLTSNILAVLKTIVKK